MRVDKIYIDNLKLDKNKLTKYKLNDFYPQLIEDFISLEGEGSGVGIASLFIRVNKCNNNCTFCDTAFSIPGSSKVVKKFNSNGIILNVDSSENLIKYLTTTYTLFDKKYVTNLTITGGEPLLNLNYLDTFLDDIKKVFKNIKRVIIETNGSILGNKTHCKLFKQKIKKFKGKIILSISPKLNAKISHSNKLSDEQVFKMYKNVYNNYMKYLKKHSGIQLKFVHSDELVQENEQFLNYILNDSKYKINRNSILIMPFTPKNLKNGEWQISKNDAARYALKNKFRYSPRIHIDRNLK